MSRTHIGDFDLLNRKTQSFETASLFGDISEKNARDFVELWKKSFDDKIKSLRETGELTTKRLADAGLEDAHWDWPKKAAIAQQAPFVSYALECAGCTQGLMLTYPAGFAREQSQKGLPITEISLLAAAPWNRVQFTSSPLYKGVGRILMSAAISLSKHEEHAGRIGLHALSGAETWYRDVCGMQDLGFDEAKRMRYFEFTEAQALKFIT